MFQKNDPAETAIDLQLAGLHALLASFLTFSLSQPQCRCPRIYLRALNFSEEGSDNLQQSLSSSVLC